MSHRVRRRLPMFATYRIEKRAGTQSANPLKNEPNLAAYGLFTRRLPN